jgi:hypothetical protein
MIIELSLENNLYFASYSYLMIETYYFTFFVCRVCVCVCVCLCVCVYICVCIYVCVYMCVCMCIYVYCEFIAIYRLIIEILKELYFLNTAHILILKMYYLN